MSQAAFDTHAEVGKLKRAGWPEGQAEAMVDLVSRTPLNPQLAQDMEWLKVRVQSTDTRLQRVETRVQGVETRLLRMEDAMSGIATKVDLEVLRGETMTSIEALRGETITHIEALRSEMLRAFWIQGLALATLIIGLAGTMLGQAA